MSQSAAPKYEIDLSIINIGDKVGIQPAYSSEFTVWPIGEVVAKTKTQLTVQANEHNKKFVIQTGKELGVTSKWHYDSLCNPAFAAWHNKHAGAQRERQQLINKFNEFARNPNKFTDDQLRAALKALGVEV